MLKIKKMGECDDGDDDENNGDGDDCQWCRNVPAMPAVDLSAAVAVAAAP